MDDATALDRTAKAAQRLRQAEAEQQPLWMRRGAGPGYAPGSNWSQLSATGGK
jgi:hypothetical protein